MTRFFALISFFFLTLSLRAGLTFEETSKEYIAKPEDRTATIEFKFKNETDREIRIEKIETGCSCLSGVTDRAEYPAGAAGTLRLEYKLGTLKGRATKSAFVRTSDGAKQILRVTVEVPELLRITPRSLKWFVDEDSGTKTIRIEASRDSPMHITNFVPTDENFEIELKVIEKGRLYELKATPKSVSSPAFTMVKVETDSTIKRFQLNQVFLVVNKKMRRVRP